MAGWSYEKLSKIFVSDILQFKTSAGQVIEAIKESQKENQEQLHDLLSQISCPNSRPLLLKTPKVNRKKAVHRIETITEDEVTDFEPHKPSSIVLEENEIKEEDAIPGAVSEENTTTGRSKRKASIKAADSIKKQQTLTLTQKLRQTDDDDKNKHSGPSEIRDSGLKRSKLADSDEEEKEERIPSKQSKVEKKISHKRSTMKHASKTIAKNTQNDDTIKPEKTEHSARVEREIGERTSTTKRTYEEIRTPSPRHSNKRPADHDHEPVNKKANFTDKTSDNHIESPEVFTYEDAIGKKQPLMHSTMIHGNITTNVDGETGDTAVTRKINSSLCMDKTITLQSVLDDRKIMNATVVLEKLPPSVCMNETVTLSKHAISEPNSRKNSGNIRRSSNRSKKSSQHALQDRLEIVTNMTKQQYEALMTDDESSPEYTKPKKLTKQRIIRASSSDDDVSDVPEAKKAYKDASSKREGMGTTKNAKKVYKPNALFSPYAKDSVRKRVEAFEQAGINCPESVETDIPPRLTRTKTRAMAAAAAAPQELTITQKMARKSLAKAKKISLNKRMMEIQESKENTTSSGASYKTNKLVPSNDKLMQKQQQRITPAKPSRLQQPMSVNRIHQTPIEQTNNFKAMSASRSNIVTNVESFLPQPKTLQKEYPTEKSEEKKRRMEEDVRKKREEALRIMIEEKKRKREEKERRNKLTREANEKREMEKRLKIEEERKEKARIALLMQEKQREEAEKKRIAQLQRAQETEERRRQEEQLRLQRLQEQEEAERQLAEQKRKEQEAAERQQHRRAAEAKAQQEAQAEALRIKAQYLAAQAKVKQYNATAKHQPAVNYVIDSEPDDDESDDETKPKYTIPSWAKPNVRKYHLAIQETVPMPIVHRFFNSKKCTPDLTQLFHGIDKSRLKRTSSAIWKTPPRYSMMARD